jgi:TonB family protein
MDLRLWIPVMAALIGGSMLIPAIGECAEEPGTTAPILVEPEEDTGACYPIGLPVRQREGQVTVLLTVAPDGKVTEVELPAGSPPWMSKAVRCVVDKLQIRAATRDGVPVEARATLPINFAVAQSDGQPPPQTAMPTLRSDKAELEATYRACYPATLTAEEAVVYRFTIGVDGLARGTSVVNGSGDRRLDKAGACVIGKLRFMPALRGGQALQATVTWTVLVRPPAAQ